MEQSDDTTHVDDDADTEVEVRSNQDRLTLEAMEYWTQTHPDRPKVKPDDLAKVLDDIGESNNFLTKSKMEHLGWENLEAPVRTVHLAISLGKVMPRNVKDRDYDSITNPIERERQKKRNKGFLRKHDDGCYSLERLDIKDRQPKLFSTEGD